MRNKTRYSDDQIHAFFKKVSPPTSNSKEHIWETILAKKEIRSDQKKENCFIVWNKTPLKWKNTYRTAAVILFLLSLTVCVSLLTDFNSINSSINEIVLTEETLIDDDTAIIESLFMEDDQEVADYLTVYVINEIVEE